MKDSNTFPDRNHPPIRLYRLLWLALGLAWACRAGLAIDGSRMMSQYLVQRWSLQEGLSGSPANAIAQTPDGYLWIGTNTGLLRFDGQSFKPVRPPGQSFASPDRVLNLLVDSAGTLWIRTQSLSVLRYIDGQFLSDVPGLRDPRITAMSRLNTGQVLLTTLTAGTGRWDGRRFVPIARGTQTVVLSNAETSDGKIWLGTRDAGLQLVTGHDLQPISRGLPDTKINCLVPGDRGQLWIGTDNGLALWDGRAISQKPLPAIVAHMRILTMLRDRDGNLWIGTMRGLIRLNQEGAFWLHKGSIQEGGSVTALSEDREGNLWFADSRGVEQLHAGPFRSYSVAEGLPAGGYGPVFAGMDGRVWFAPLEGGLYRLGDGNAHRVTDDGLGSDIVYSISGSGDDVWVGRQRGGLTHLREVSGAMVARTYTRADGLSQNAVFAVHECRDGSVWAGTLTSGVSRFAGGRFRNYTSRDGLASNTVSSIAEGADGTMWFATPNGLSSLRDGRWRTYTARDGLPSSNVGTIFADRQGALWIGTDRGIAFFLNGRVTAPVLAEGLDQAPAIEVTEDGSGAMWIETGSRLLRVNRQALIDAADLQSGASVYGPADGLRDAEVARREHSMTTDSEGRVWVSTNSGLSAVEAQQLNAASPPAISHIDSVIVDGVPTDQLAHLQISSARHRIAINYLGLSFAVPQRVRYRYWLEGFDHAWSDPAAVQQAIYTNLAPGPYRFRVMASNSEGQWNGPEADLEFQIEPRFWQMWTFRLLALLALCVAAAAAYRIRIRQVMHQADVRFGERLAERMRIAQELHDTLLQGFLSASLQLHVAVDALEESSPARPRFQHVLAVVNEVMEEGRNAVRGLRKSDAAVAGLENRIAKIAEEAGCTQVGHFELRATGAARPLHAVVDEEICRIVREALLNAIRHAEAKTLEVQIDFSAAHLRIQVWDDGRGMDEVTLAAGRDGHWGLLGMRERAKKIGARLQLWSQASVGTRVVLSVPGHVAYIRQNGRSPLARAKSIFARLRNRAGNPRSGAAG